MTAATCESPQSIGGAGTRTAGCNRTGAGAGATGTTGGGGGGGGATATTGGGATATTAGTGSPVILFAFWMITTGLELGGGVVLCRKLPLASAAHILNTIRNFILSEIRESKNRIRTSRRRAFTLGNRDSAMAAEQDFVENLNIG